MSDEPITVTVTRADRTWAADVDGYGEVTARNLLELVGVAHNLVLLKDNQPRALAFVYPFRAERDLIRERQAAVDKATQALEAVRETVRSKLADAGVTAADLNRLLDAP